MQPKLGLSSRDETFANQLRDALQDQSVDSRSAVTQRMMRDISLEENTKYKQMGHAEKARFRMKYAAGQATDFLMTQTHEEGWKRVDRNHGEYVSASRYWQLEGGTQADLEPTIAAITKCTKMGWPFCAWNDLTDRFDFLRLHKEFDEEFSKSWAIFKKSNIDPKKTADADTSTGGEAIVDSKRKNLIEKSAKKPKIAGDSSKQRGWSDRTPGQILQEAVKMKAKYVDITSRSLQLKKNIADDASWAWAVAATEPFDGAYGAVMQAALLEFPTMLHTHDLAGVKKTMSPETLTKECIHYVDNCGSILEALNTECKRLIRMHLARTE